jgi:hypothetical protein
MKSTAKSEKVTKERVLDWGEKKWNLLGTYYAVLLNGTDWAKGMSDGYKQDGDDGKDHMFGKSYVRVRKEKPVPGGVRYIPALPLRKPDAEV